MAKPVGLKTTLKDNSKKLYRNHTEWMIAKKLGRPKQVWVESTGHWEKVA